MRTLENKLFELEQRQWTKGEFDEGEDRCVVGADCRMEYPVR